ncbi:MAG: Holliday junction branch migration protein RuvA [Brevinematia bacterium]
MFSFIKGRIAGKEEGRVIVECNGIGYEILLSLKTFEALPESGEEVNLFLKFIIKENEVSLVGFLTPEEKKIFELLISVNGVGLKQSLRILSELSVNDIRKAIISQNEKAFAGVKGIGSKLASRIILELGDKIKKVEPLEDAGQLSEVEKKKMEVLMALRVLGYSDFEAKKTIENVFSDKDNINNMGVEEIIKRVLALMVR